MVLSFMVEGFAIDEEGILNLKELIHIPLRSS